jgi:Nuclear RNA-splicing-associated protein
MEAPDVESQVIAQPFPSNNAQIDTTDPAATESTVEEDDDRKCRQRNMAPMSREEYERQQSQVRQVLDVETGRMRLVRGTGEIIETMVSRAQHAAINQQATRGDSSTFARSVFHAAGRR